MTAVTTPAPTAETPDVLKDNGLPYRFLLVHSGGQTFTYGDTLADVIDAIIPGYKDADEDGRIEKRVKAALDLLAPTQARLVAALDPGTVDEDTMKVLLSPRHEPIRVKEWTADTPLVLLDAHYKPLGDIDPPVVPGDASANPHNIVWLRTTDELDFLDSLAAVGLVALHEASLHRS